jgi:uroporphyrinogen-III decarboxylase
MTNLEEWAKLTWQEKREKRFERWLNPEGVKFINQEAKEKYKQRVNRFIKAFKMEEPDRVPVWLPVGTVPAYHYGVDYYTIMWDYKVMHDAYLKFMHDFGDMDQYGGPAFIHSGKISSTIDSKISLTPGHGLPKTSSMHETVEGEYMKADEYDLYMSDPSDYVIRVLTPRTTGLQESFKKLPPLRTLQGSAWLGALANPEIRKTFKTMIELTEEYEKYNKALHEIDNEIKSYGYPSFQGGPRCGCPFDHFADLLRGTRGIAMDLRRQPKKLHQALEWYTQLTISSLKDFPMTENPICGMALHKGDDTFMSDAQFQEFYWPYLRRVLMAIIEEGLIPMPFAEGKYTKRLKYIKDTPKTAVVWYFDQTDMAAAKKALADSCCIAGNVPTSVLMTGTPQTVKNYCKNLIDDCKSGGGFVLAGGASLNTGNLANLKAMMESAYAYGVYSGKNSI